MSDRVGESYHDGDRRSGQSVHSHHSVWMSRWTQTSCRATPRVRDCLSLHLERKDDHDFDKQHLLSELGMTSDISPSAKVYTEVTEVRTARIMKEASTSSKNTSNRGLELQPFPMFKLSQDVSSGMGPKRLEIPGCRQVTRPQIDCNVVYNVHTTLGHFPSVLAVAPAAVETSSKECQPEGVKKSHPVNSPSVVMGEGSSLANAPSRGNFTGSTQMMPCRLKKGKAAVSSSFMNRPEELNQLTPILGHDWDDYRSHSSLLVREKKLDTHSTSVKSGSSFLRQRNASQLVEDAFTGSHHLSMLVGDRCQKEQNSFGTHFFPSHGSSPEAANPENSDHHECYAQRGLLDSVYDGETSRISTKNLVEGLAGVPGVLNTPTALGLSFLKKADVNLSEENLSFKESGVSTKLKRNMFSELLRLSPPIPMGENRQKLKLQPLGSFTGCEGKDNVEGVETSEFRLKNESSAETDTLDMDTLKEHNSLPGVNSSPSKKDILTGQNPPPSQPTITSAGEEVRCRWSVTSLPDINVEIPSLPAATTSMDNAEPSTSRTQSFDAEHLLLHTDHDPSKTKSSPNPNGSVRLDPSSRWLKRFKLSSSDSLAVGTKSSDLGEALSHKKVNKLLGKISRPSTKSCSLEPRYGKSPHEEELAIDQTSIVSRKGDSSWVESGKKGRDMLVSHPWIQRWCHNRATSNQKKPNAEVVCEPQSTKVDFDELRNKQFPSIAAMALMAKAMTGFQPCEFQKKGSFIVWNTKGF